MTPIATVLIALAFLQTDEVSPRFQRIVDARAESALSLTVDQAVAQELLRQRDQIEELKRQIAEEQKIRRNLKSWPWWAGANAVATAVDIFTTGRGIRIGQGRIYETNKNGQSVEERAALKITGFVVIVLVDYACRIYDQVLAGKIVEGVYTAVGLYNGIKNIVTTEEFIQENAP